MEAGVKDDIEEILRVAGIQPAEATAEQIALADRFVMVYNYLSGEALWKAAGQALWRRAFGSKA